MCRDADSRLLKSESFAGGSDCRLLGCQDDVMSYDLAVWVGPRPASKEDADAEYARRMDQMEAQYEQAERPQPASELVAFVEAALDRYPELDAESGPETPWASSPLANEIFGDLIYFPLTFSGAEYARDVLADIADSLGLVCYDPQIEGLLPDASAAPAAAIGKQAAAALGAYVAKRDQPARSTSWLQRLLRRNTH